MSDPDGVSRRFDPRFSPAFQPGYDPRVHREEPPSAPLREEPRRDWDELRAPRPEPATRPVFDVVESGQDEPAEIDVDLAPAEPLPWWRRFNPWLVVLWLLGLGFILGGLWLTSFAALAFRSGEPQGGADAYLLSMLAQMSFFGAPMFVTLGLATLTSTVVILAARWRRP
ncbi:MAG TPA: hypothetical protein VIQ78_02900 [Terrimesophilobacter sp.]|uniref:hypothetical protein n=1 Tax=Terrimesophilobacter sp. TaxID=2906435 RepID=UPI002F92AFF1